MYRVTLEYLVIKKKASIMKHTKMKTMREIFTNAWRNKNEAQALEYLLLKSTLKSLSNEK